MRNKRIIPCLDVKDGRVVKGIHFAGLADVGDPVECACLYERQGADELVLLDITATQQGRKTMTDMVRRCAQQLSIPLTVGGGIRTAEDAEAVLQAGADKISINSAAVRNPDLIQDIAKRCGKERLVVAIDAKRNARGGFSVVIAGGAIDTGMDAAAWAQQAQRLGCGEILLTSMDADGTKNGYDLALTDAVCRAVDVPVIASGGCGALAHFSDVFEKTGADAALAASLFHYRVLGIPQVKQYLREKNIPVRL